MGLTHHIKLNAFRQGMKYRIPNKVDMKDAQKLTQIPAHRPHNGDTPPDNLTTVDPTRQDFRSMKPLAHESYKLDRASR